MSSSVILTKQLEQETADLKKYLGDFLEERSKSFTDGLKHEMGKLVKKQLLSFYHPPSHDMALFDEDGKDILADLKSNYRMKDHDAFLNQPNTRCFILKEGSSTFYFFEKDILVLEQNQYEGKSFRILPHTLHTNILRTIKHIQLGKLEQGLTLYRVHPEFFHSECMEFEDLCSREYEHIYEKKREFDRNIEDRQHIEREREQLEKDKKHWISIHQKMEKVKQDMDKVLSMMES